jgi:hypothetical protein
MTKIYTIKDALLIRSKRKTVAIQIKPDCSLIIRAPMRMSTCEINKFLAEKSDWIEKNLEKQQKNIDKLENTNPMSQEELAYLTDMAKHILPKKVEYFADLIGVDFDRITIRHQKSRWGSCSSKGNLNFNCLIMLMPDEIIDYIVVHELCHRKEMNHSYNFKREVEKILPDYKKRELWLKENSSAIMLRLSGI